MAHIPRLVVSLLTVVLFVAEARSEIVFDALDELDVESPSSITLGDFDEDGVLDLAAVSTAHDAVSVLLGDGAGGFDEPDEHAVGDFPFHVAHADLDGDGHLDLVATNFFGGNFSVLLGAGDGSFAEQQEFECGSVPTSVAIADYDEDGALDIVVANHDASTLTIHVGDGAGGFALEATMIVAHFPAFVMAADLDEDGHEDLFFSNSLESTFTILLGDGDALFPDVEEVALGADDAVWSLYPGDVDEDGHLDVIVPCPTYDAIGVFLGDGEGGFADPQSFGVGRYPRRLALDDFDADGHVDIACLNSALQDVSICANDGTGALTAGGLVEAFSNVSDIACGDLNGDGKADLIVSGDIGDRIQVHLNATPDPEFKRGDADRNGSVELVDAITVLDALFGIEDEAIDCEDALDANDDGRLGIQDAVVILLYLYTESGSSPPEPGPNACGADPSADELRCAVVSEACE